VEWVDLADVAGVAAPPAPQNGAWEDWTHIALSAL